MPSTKQAPQAIIQVPSAAVSQQQLNTLAASTTSGNKTPQEYPEFIKQALATIEKKAKNLNKRKKKLEEYRDIQTKGTTLNADQLNAVSKYDEVIYTLELLEDLDKQMVALANDALKAQKKQTKKEQIEREELLRDKLKDVRRIQSLLNSFQEETIRSDFLNESNGAVRITQDELNLIDEFHRYSNQTKFTADNELTESVDHYLSLIDGKNKPFSSTNFSELKKLFDRILTCSYWTQEKKEEEKNENANSSTEDFVVVQSHEIEEHENGNHHQQIEQPEQQVQQHQEIVQQQDQATFFSTLDQPQNYVQEILTENNEGLNFLQDSQVLKQSSHSEQEPVPQESQQEPEQVNTAVFTNQRYNQDGKENRQYGFQKRYDNGDRNGGGQRRQYSNEGGDERRGSGRGGYRGGYEGGRGGRGGPRGGGQRGAFRGKPRGGGGYNQRSTEVHNE